MEEIKVGEYVRTRYGEIAKITQTFPQIKGIKRVNPSLMDFNLIVKHSFNIIDLIEEGDYVNGEEVIEIRKQDGKIYLMTGYVPQKYIKTDIKTIVTKEQMESVEYRLEN